MREEKFETILQKPFVKNILSYGGEIFFIGGAVRDYYLKKEPKDFDLVVSKMPLTTLTSILQQYGIVDLVGESFGVIRFKEATGPYKEYTGFECEIALPRKDSIDKTKKGHRAIIAQSDPFIPIEIDLLRRDFTVNSMAFDQDLKLIDPFNGLQDLRTQKIKATSKDSFIDDPLRLLRAIQLTARFCFTIEHETWVLIKENSHLIKQITPERILMEFQKVIDKKQVWLFLTLLQTSTLFETIFGFKLDEKLFEIEEINKISTIGELLMFIVRGESSLVENWGTFFESKLKIDLKTKKELRAYEKLNYAFYNNFIVIDNRNCFFECLKIAPWIFNSEFFNLPGIDKQDFERKIYPKSFKDLEVNGEDFLKLGFEGKEIGDLQTKIVEMIMSNKLVNDRQKILNFIKKVKYE